MRDGLVSAAWLEERIAASEREIALRRTDLMSSSGDPSYRPQFVGNLSRAFLTLLLRCYGRGDPIRNLAQYIEPLLDTWEEAERLGQAVWTEAQHHSRGAWSMNLDHYIRCFWLVGLALALDVPDNQWLRLLALIGNKVKTRCWTVSLRADSAGGASAPACVIPNRISVFGTPRRRLLRNRHAQWPTSSAIGTPTSTAHPRPGFHA